MSASSPLFFSIHFFIAQALKRTFFFLIAQDTSYQFEIKFLQLVNNLDNYLFDIGSQIISNPSPQE